MLAANVYAEERDVNTRLASFGVTKSELIEVVRSTLGERLNSVAVDPLGTPGTLSYIAGTRHIRWLFLPKGWSTDRTKNIESVINPANGIKIAYQNVDMAGSPHRSPKAIAGKRGGSASLIEEAQGSLFLHGELPEAVDLASVRSLGSSMWYLCVSFNGEDIRAELSLPASVKDGNFHGFLERILLLQSGEWAKFTINEDNDDTVEFEPTIARR
ncbi:hypothetical protein FHS21_001360 [Phyllobacterium trifolii]|uniref:Uncharacterized protein n=1 Tax=Phyllobacterium trifolii TaxID=300193 RepID=A0A839U9M9_9HYPH|nr:hypothetical protein [Phyllobacterium trifolii]MBB3144959.1 hypothetical protein [Phyllobacterium trifolii]